MFVVAEELLKYFKKASKETKKFIFYHLSSGGWPSLSQN
jgi:hypothetical protein